MDELLLRGQWWWLLVVPLFTGLLALFGSWFGSRLGRLSEQKQWTRNRKQEAYGRFLRNAHLSASSVVEMLDPDLFEKQLQTDRLSMEALWELRVVASEKVSDAAIQLVNDTKTYRRLLTATTAVQVFAKSKLAQTDLPEDDEYRQRLQTALAAYESEHRRDLTLKAWDVVAGSSNRLLWAMQSDLKLAKPKYSKDWLSEEMLDHLMGTLRRNWQLLDIDVDEAVKDFEETMSNMSRLRSNDNSS